MEVNLGYGYTTIDTHIRAVVFGELVKLAAPVVKNYVSDLYHDVTWLNDFASGEDFTFFYGVRESGTSIGTDERPVSAYNTHTWEIHIGADGRKFKLTITERIKELQVL